MTAGYALLLPFDTEGPEFARGFEAGRLWALMRDADGRGARSQGDRRGARQHLDPSAGPAGRDGTVNRLVCLQKGVGGDPDSTPQDTGCPASKKFVKSEPCG